MTEETNTTIIHIEDLDRPKRPLPVATQSETLSSLAKGKVYSSSFDSSDFTPFGPHSAFYTFIYAYQFHFPIALSPDIIWLLIVQGFSRYVNYNAEELRHYFVNFEGKKELQVQNPPSLPESMTKEQWETVFSSVCNEISKHVGKDLINELTPNFTTTTPTSLTACQLSMMATFKRYFHYRSVLFKCGIPSVYLEGTVEDWQKVKAKVQTLAKYKLPWADKLDNIINEFINAKEGKINLSFWKTIVREKDSHDCYDPRIYTGWFAYLFPYDDGGNLYNGKISQERKAAKDILSSPLTLDVNLGPSYNLNLLSGFVGAKQDPNTFSIKPVIGWIVGDQTDE